MEFNEKLQALRRQKDWTQEQLAEKLFVSRTAVSKWESGKGYPNIESLKLLSKALEVSIDDLLSGEEWIAVAETENHRSLKKVYAALFGVLDVLALLLVFLPLYGNPADGGVHAVSLFAFTAAAVWIRAVYWALLLALTAAGTLELLLVRLGKAESLPVLPNISLALGGAAVLFFAVVKEPYGTALLFLLFLGKLFLVVKRGKMK